MLEGILFGAGIGFPAGFLVSFLMHITERKQWMQFATTNTFETPKARSYTPETAESRVDHASKVVTDWSQDSVGQGMRDLKAIYKSEGLPVPKDKELRKEAEAMLNAAAQGEGAIDV